VDEPSADDNVASPGVNERHRGLLEALRDETNRARRCGHSRRHLRGLGDTSG
jgi:hypothetical protein